MSSRHVATGGCARPATWVLALSLLVFAVLAVAHGSAPINVLDERLLLALRDAGNPSNPLGPLWLESAVRDVTALGSRTVLAAVLASTAGYLAVIGRWRRAFALLACTLGGCLLAEVAKAGFVRPRPDLVPHGVAVASLSFPSAHAMQASVVYLSIAAMIGAHEPSLAGRSFLMATAALVAAAVGVSRVYFGVHWPSDVAAGWALGTAWASACWLVEARIVQHRSTRTIQQCHPPARSRHVPRDR